MDFERLPVECPADGGSSAAALGIFFLREQIVARALGGQRRAIQQAAGQGIRAGLREHVQMLFRAVVFAGETEKLE